MRLILASQSMGRRTMLKAAGIPFAVVTSGVDETALTATYKARPGGCSPAGLALHLARAKAEAVSRLHGDSVVIGSDQVLAIGDEWLDKPGDLEGARATIERLRGRTHILHSAVALAEGGGTVWHHVDQALLTMRNVSDDFLTHYLAMAGEGIFGSVGAYHLEGPGTQLFDNIDGDYFTILGMPLLPLLRELRARGVIAT